MKLYELILNEARPFFGDQADQFVNRQCILHLNISKEALTKEHLPKLAWWIRISAALVISRDKAEILSKKILALAE